MLEAGLTMLSDFAVRFWNGAPVKIWLTAFAIGIVLELTLRHAERGQSWRGYWRNSWHVVVYLTVYFVTAPSLGVAVGILREYVAFLPRLDLDFVGTDTVPGQITIGLLSVFITDFFIYWWHRAQHAFPWLWHQHAVHHSDEELNIITSVRVHWTEFMFQIFLISLPMTTLFKITPNGAGVVGTVIAVWIFLQHANVRVHFGWLSYVIAGPQLHRIHHSRLSEHQDKNFAAYFPFWDVVFRTYHHPKRDEYPPTGVPGIKIERLWMLSAYPFMCWIAALWATLRRTRSATQLLGQRATRSSLSPRG